MLLKPLLQWNVRRLKFNIIANIDFQYQSTFGVFHFMIDRIFIIVMGSCFYPVVEFVIDSGYVKQKVCNPKTGMETLVVSCFRFVACLTPVTGC